MRTYRSNLSTIFIPISDTLETVIGVHRDDEKLGRIIYGGEDIAPDDTFADHEIEDGGRLELFFRS